MSTSPNTDRAAWGSIPTFVTYRPQCAHCQSFELTVYKSRERSTGALLQYAKCSACKRKTKILQQLVQGLDNC